MSITHSNSYFVFGGVELIEDDEVATKVAVRQLGAKLKLLSTAPHFQELQLTPVWSTADYKITGRGSNLVFQNLDPSSGAGIELYPEPTSVTSDVEFLLYGFGDPTDQTNYERIEFKWDESDTQFQILTGSAGTGSPQPISIFTEGKAGQIVLLTDGSTTMSFTATENDAFALEIITDAAGFSEISALDLFFTTGALAAASDEDVLAINIDDTLSVGGDVFGVGVFTTAGAASVYGLFAGAQVGPIIQLSGTFTDADTVLVKAVDQTVALANGGAGNISVFVADNDTLTIGEATKFEEIEFLLGTVSSGGGIAPTFEYSTGVGTWATFSPLDGTSGLRNNGVVVWLDSDIPSWAVGTGTEFLIRMTRTRNSLTTSPILNEVQISADAQFSWDKNADLTINDLVVADITASGDFSVAGTLFVAQNLEHTGDPDTLFKFTTNRVQMTAGGREQIDMTTAKLIFGGTATDVDVVIHDASNAEMFRADGGTGDVTIANDLVVSGDVYVASKIYHTGDINTFIDFVPDTITIEIGGEEAIQFTPADTIVGGGASDVDFKIQNATPATIFNVDVSASDFFFGAEDSIRADLTIWGTATVGGAVMWNVPADYDTNIVNWVIGIEDAAQLFVIGANGGVYGDRNIISIAETGQVTIAQSRTAAALAVLVINQADIDDTFIDFVGTSAADSSRSISSSTAEAAAKFGAFMVEINGVTKWVRVYDSAV